MLTKDNFPFDLFFMMLTNIAKCEKLSSHKVFHLNKWNVTAVISVFHPKLQVASTSLGINLSNKLW